MRNAFFRNGEECIKFAQQDRNSENRERFPEEENLNVGIPSIQDFGEIAERFGQGKIILSSFAEFVNY